MAAARDEEKPWKTDLARKSAQRRVEVLKDIEESIKKAPSFEEALRIAAESMKRRFARFSAVTVYVADGEDLAMQIALERPQGPDRVLVGRRTARRRRPGDQLPTVVTDLSTQSAWGGVGLSKGSAVVAPVRTEAGQAVHGGGHGDYPRIVLAPASVQEANDLMGLSFELAEQYRMICMVILDGSIGQMMEPAEMPE